ncbi:MAG: antitoxin [Candidatus Brocadiaceae bacterium]|nr:antitoxin [Candidatus Brocadiaceae bacterium]
MIKNKLDDFEKNIEKDILKFKKVSSKKFKKIEDIIEKSNEKKNISLRVNNQDLEQIKLKAENEGIPYQTLISSVLHKFVTDQLVDQKNIIKCIQLLNKQKLITK